MDDAELRKRFAIPDEIRERLVPSSIVPKKAKHFIRVPIAWADRLDDAVGQTYRVALRLLYLHWQQHGGPVRLGNMMLKLEGTSRQSKWRALRDLERRGLVELETCPRKSPIVRLKNLSHP
jgi:hypothetical protein